MAILLENENDDDIPKDSIILLNSIGRPPPNQYHLYTICALAVRCSHDSMAICSLHSSDHFWWLPYIAVQECFKWSEIGALIAKFFCQKLKIPYEQSNFFPYQNIFLHRLSRIQLPNGEFIQQNIYTAQWRFENNNCCQNTKNLKWIPLKQFQLDSISSNSIINQFWGSEVITYASLLSNQQKQMIQVIEQTGQTDAFKYVTQSDNKEKIKNQSSTKALFSKFLSEISINEKEVTKIYNDYVQHCYPSINMSFVSFEEFAKKIHLGTAIDLNVFFLKNIFRAMNYKVKNYIGFNEFLLGLLSLDPKAPNSRPRHTFLFRYYDSNSDGFLDRDDIRCLNADLQRLNKNTLLINFNKKMNYDTFVAEINSGAIRGTELLCRTSKSIIKILHDSYAYEMIQFDHRPFGSKITAKCPKCRPKNYTLAIHSLQLNKNGRLTSPKIISNTHEDNLNLNKSFIAKHSIEYIFKSTSNANYVLELVRKLSGYSKMTEDQKKEIRNKVINGLSINVIKTICDEVSEIFSIESRVIKVSTPTFVLGDIHGNINDLLIFEEQLWPMAPAVHTANVLFLGDYVDRGEFSIEVVCYLFAMKIMSPVKFFLLRGNHEVRSIQRSFTFEKECNEKYGRYGANVFEMFNKVFDILPFAAIVDESIYCAHGGIPFTQTKIEDLMRLPLVLKDPELEAPAVWEILWSDPMANVEFNELVNFLRSNNTSGYLSNVKRSTAFYFSEKATQNFLKQNNLTHVIRAHEVINEGYKFNHQGIVITVFSCSKYCGGPNKAAAIMIEGFDQKGFIKIISLDTEK